MCCALGLGLVLASPESDSPPGAPELELLLVLLLELLLELLVLLELLDPHAATTTAQAIAARGMSVSRNRRIYSSSCLVAVSDIGFDVSFIVRPWG
jgi:hypothetical protein